MTCILATKILKVSKNVSNGFKAILCHAKLKYTSHLIFIFMNMNKMFRHWGKNTESIRRYTCKNAHILAADRPRELTWVANDCFDKFSVTI